MAGIRNRAALIWGTGVKFCTSQNFWGLKNRGNGSITSTLTFHGLDPPFASLVALAFRYNFVRCYVLLVMVILEKLSLGLFKLLVLHPFKWRSEFSSRVVRSSLFCFVLADNSKESENVCLFFVLSQLATLLVWFFLLDHSTLIIYVYMTLHGCVSTISH